MSKLPSLLLRALVAMLAAGIFYSTAAEAAAERIKDLASVAGVRDNQLVGYGLVVGLDGSGDQTTQTPFTVQSIINMLGNMGVALPPGKTDEDFVLGLLRAKGVLCVYGSGFGAPADQGFFRVVFLASPDELTSIYDDVASFTADFLNA